MTRSQEIPALSIGAQANKYRRRQLYIHPYLSGAIALRLIVVYAKERSTWVAAGRPRGSSLLTRLLFHSRTSACLPELGRCFFSARFRPQ